MESDMDLTLFHHVCTNQNICVCLLISTISSFKGYYTQGGALEVGIASTQAVTTSIIAILLADYFLAYLLI